MGCPQRSDSCEIKDIPNVSLDSHNLAFEQILSRFSPSRSSALNIPQLALSKQVKVKGEQAALSGFEQPVLGPGPGLELLLPLSPRTRLQGQGLLQIKYSATGGE